MDSQVAGFHFAQITTRREGLAEGDDGEEYFLAEGEDKFPARSHIVPYFPLCVEIV